MKLCRLGNWLGAAVLAAACSSSGLGQAASTGGAAPSAQEGHAAPSQTKETRITPQQAKELFLSLDGILAFASEDTKLPIRHQVKRRLITRDQVEKYVLAKFHDDKDAQQMQREEIVLKKFGLLDRDFELQPFLVSLLKEQIAGFYDNKTKTVNLLDWVAPEDQKLVMAHELTHALQDQHADLDKWEPAAPVTVSRSVAEDNERLAADERDTARDAVLEGQAMAVYLDYGLKPAGKSLLTSPDVSQDLDAGASDGSSVMSRAPLLLQEELLFPYRDGLQFEQTLLKDKGAEYAFAGVLDRPPSTSYEIMNPRAYERKQEVPLLHMPDVHAVIGGGRYEPYDIGVMGELDVRVLSELFGGDAVAAALTPEWNGGIYYAARSRTANAAEAKGSTASLGLLYLSAWRSEGAAEEFAEIYGRELSKKYSGVTRDIASESSPNERIYRTSEGPVLIVRQGREVFVSESFDLDLARKLQFLMFGAQHGDETQAIAAQMTPDEDLTAPLSRVLDHCGVVRAAIQR